MTRLIPSTNYISFSFYHNKRHGYGQREEEVKTKMYKSHLFSSLWKYLHCLISPRSGR